MKYTTNLNLKKPDYTDPADIQNINDNMDAIDTKITTHLADNLYQVATGTSTAIALTGVVLENGHPKTFIASANNNGSSSTINTKHLYKPNTTIAPNLIAGKAYTVWYNSASDCFFIKASAEGNTIASHVLAGDTFSNDEDTGILGSMDLSDLTADNIRKDVTINGITGDKLEYGIGGELPVNNVSFTVDEYINKTVQNSSTIWYKNLCADEQGYGYALCSNKNLIKVNFSNNSVVWTRTMTTDNANISCDGTNVYLIDGTNLRKIDMNSGNDIWTQSNADVATRICYSKDILFDDTYLYIINGSTSKISKVRKSDGAVIWTSEADTGMSYCNYCLDSKNGYIYYSNNNIIKKADISNGNLSAIFTLSYPLFASSVLGVYPTAIRYFKDSLYVISDFTGGSSKIVYKLTLAGEYTNKSFHTKAGYVITKYGIYNLDGGSYGLNLDLINSDCSSIATNFVTLYTDEYQSGHTAYISCFDATSDSVVFSVCWSSSQQYQYFYKFTKKAYYTIQ